MILPFFKMHGAANDFVVVDVRERAVPEPIGPWVAKVCDRRRGVGADGVLLLAADRDYDFAMRYYNADGQSADYCGNGARCLARLALDLGMGGGREVQFRTGAGGQRARRAGNGRLIELEFGRVQAADAPIDVEAAGRHFEGVRIVAGVPHFVTPVERVEWVPVAEWGTALRHHERFGPEGANVDFVAPLGASRVAMRTYERGVEGETLACGSGAIATAIWAAGQGHASPVQILTAGGDELSVGFRAASGGYDVSLTGPAEFVFEGEWTEATVRPVGQP
jgi:diaminopimelate epimerase